MIPARRHWLAIVTALALAGCGGSAPASAPPSSAPPASAAPAATKPAAAASSAAAKPAASASAKPAASAAAKPAASGLTTVKMGAQGQFAEVGVYVGLEKGYFSQLGLDVQPEHINTVGQEMPLLATGQLAFGAGGGGDPAYFNAILHDVDVRIVGPDTIAGPNGDVTAGIMVRQDLIDSGKYTSPKDLKGMTIGLVSEHTLAEYVVAGALAKGGYKLTDAKITTLPFPDTIAAFGNKGIDAAFLVEPFVTAAQAKHLAKLVIPSGDILPDAVGNVLMMSGAWAKSNQDAAQKFVTGWLKGQRDYYHAFNAKDQPALQQEVINALTKYTAIKDPATYQQIGLPWVAPNGDLATASMDTLQDYYVATGVQPKKVDLNKVIDRSYVEKAVQQLGRVRV